jgi:hypothetical protein
MFGKIATAIVSMASELAAEPLWQPYAEFLELRANRAQERALQAAAESFVEVARHWPYEERKRFSLWLMDRAARVMEQIGRPRNSSRLRSVVSPAVVIDTILLPTLAEWCEREPGKAEPHFWAGLYSARSYNPDRHPVTCLREAIRLDPTYVPAREALARHILEAISDNQHELPSGYLRDGPEDDLLSLREVEELVAEPVDAGVRGSLQERISTLRSAAENWIEHRRKRASEAPR